MAVAKITGERVSSPAGGFNPTWQRHVAAYALAARELGPGRVMDLGCGVGHSHHLLAPRETVGVDVDPAALAGQDRETVVADMRDLPFADQSFDSVVSVHSIEHVPDPERGVAEVARVLRADGTAVFVTPNRLTFGRPDEIIDPYHHVEVDAEQLRELCGRFFTDVEVRGVFGSPRYLELFEGERDKLGRLLALDPLRLRRFAPAALKRRAYDTLLRRNRVGDDPRQAAIEPDDFFGADAALDTALDVYAVCRGPVVRVVTRCVWCDAAIGRDAQRLPGRVVCPACGTGTSEPFPTDAELAAGYSGWYRPASGERFGRFGDALLARTRGALATTVDEGAPAGSVLDIGAGDGTLVDALRARGRDATGIEREPQRDDLRDVPLEDLEPGWAAVVLWHALEHLAEPGAAIREAARLLAPGGLLVVAVPNAASLQARVFGHDWLGLDPPRHLVHLTAASLQAGIEANGLTVTRTSRIRGGQIAIGWLDGLVKRAGDGLDLYQALRRPQARAFEMSSGTRLTSLAAGAVLAPLALACSAVEVLLDRPGVIYVEARRSSTTV